MKWLGPVSIVAVALLLELSLGRASSGPDLALFLGRFHPLVVHLPIGFFLLVALAEGATFAPRLRERVEPALGLLLPLSAVAALAAFAMGQLLALEGGFPAAALGWHRRLTLLAIVGMVACWVLYQRAQHGGGGRLAYRGALVATLGALSLGAHFGGTMTRGESYLSKYAPGPLKPLLGAAEEPRAQSVAPGAQVGREPLVFDDVVQPILNNYCFECHGTEKQKGKLRVDSLALILAGGESGAVLVPGEPQKSPLLTRMRLPMSDDERMPPEGKPSPKPEELALIQFWIERGATPSLKVRDALAPAVSRALLERSLGGGASSSAVPNAVAAPSSQAAEPAPPSVPPAPSATGSGSGTGTGTSSVTGTSSSAVTAKSAEPTVAAPVAEPRPGTPAVSSGPAFLATYCEKCHGSAKQKGKLRVDSLAALLRGGASGAALVPGKPEQSPLFQRLRLPLDDDEHMPPPKEAQPTAAEVAVLAAWIRGASAAASSSSPTASSPTGASPTASPSGSLAAASSPQTSSTTTGPTTTGPTTTEPTPTATPTSASPSPTSPSAAAERAPGAASFPAVQALFREKCGKCHIREKPAGGLAVEQHAQLLEGGYSGPGIVPGDRKASVIMQRLLLPASDDEHMPPVEEPALSASELELVGAWIDQGAPASGPSQSTGATVPPATAGAGKSGGCAACSVPGAQPTRWLALQSLGLLATVALIAVRRRGRGRRR